MQRLYEDHAYSDAPLSGCLWTADAAPARAAFDGPQSTEVAVIGGGFTGLSAALHLAEAGTEVTLLEARHIGWGASGRNGGFCCLGGGWVGHGG